MCVVSRLLTGPLLLPFSHPRSPHITQQLGQSFKTLSLIDSRFFVQHSPLAPDFTPGKSQIFTVARKLLHSLTAATSLASSTCLALALQPHWSLLFLDHTQSIFLPRDLCTCHCLCPEPFPPGSHMTYTSFCPSLCLNVTFSEKLSLPT